MSMNKKILLISIILFCLFSFTVVDASLVDGALLVAEHTYVGENICSEDSVQRILKLVGYILIIVKVLVPLIIIVIGSFDLFQAVVGKDEKALTKGIKSLVFRVLLGVFIFFIPSFVNWAFDLFYETAGGDNNKQCITCVLDPGNCGSISYSGSNGDDSNNNRIDIDNDSLIEDQNNIDYSIYLS